MDLISLRSSGGMEHHSGEIPTVPFVAVGAGAVTSMIAKASSLPRREARTLQIGTSKMRDLDDPQHRFKLLAYEGELDQIAGWASASPDLETGGDLFGFWTHGGAPTVEFVLGPGP